MTESVTTALSVLFGHKITSLNDLTSEEVNRVFRDLVSFEAEIERLRIIARLETEPVYEVDEPTDDDSLKEIPSKFADQVFNAISVIFPLRDPNAMRNTVRTIGGELFEALRKQSS